MTLQLLEMIYEHQLLASKDRELGIELDPSDRVRRMSLERLLRGEVPDETRRRFARASDTIAVQFTRPGGFEGGEVHDLGGGGFRIATPRPPELGTRLVVRLEAPSDGVEYVFPCRVVWRARRPGRMGVALDGVPHKSELFGEETTGVWRKSVTLGAARKDPLVA